LIDINAQKIQAALSTNGAELGIAPEFRRIQPQFDIHVFDELASTNTRLWALLAAGASSGCVAIAQRQSSGRGQRGRYWHSKPGGLYLSLALEPDWPVPHSAQLTSLSAWGIATAFNNLGIPIKIKWPNDLFFQGKKLGGILTETKLAHFPRESRLCSKKGNPLPRIKQAVIGVGINWHNPVPETGITLAKILESMPELSAKNKINCLEMLAALVLKGILQGAFFHQQVRSQVFMKAYGNLLTQVGKVVSLDQCLLAFVGSDIPAIAPPGLWNTAHGLVNGLVDSSVGYGATGKASENYSGEVVGVSEEGYLQVLVRGVINGQPIGQLSTNSSRPSPLRTDRLHAHQQQAEYSPNCVLLLKPSGE